MTRFLDKKMTFMPPRTHTRNCDGCGKSYKDDIGAIYGKCEQCLKEMLGIPSCDHLGTKKVFVHGRWECERCGQVTE